MQRTEILLSTSMEVDENVDIDTDEDSPSTSSKLPFILTGEFFKVTANSTDEKIIAQCQNCPKTISGSRTSTGNFVSHYNVSFYTHVCIQLDKPAKAVFV